MRKGRVFSRVDKSTRERGDNDNICMVVVHTPHSELRNVPGKFCLGWELAVFGYGFRNGFNTGFKHGVGHARRLGMQGNFLREFPVARPSDYVRWEQHVARELGPRRGQALITHLGRVADPASMPAHALRQHSEWTQDAGVLRIGQQAGECSLGFSMLAFQFRQQKRAFPGDIQPYSNWTLASVMKEPREVGHVLRCIGEDDVETGPNHLFAHAGLNVSERFAAEPWQDFCRRGN